MTNRLRSLASRVITSWARPSAGPPRDRRRGGPVDERHHRDRGAARRSHDDVGAAAARCGASAAERRPGPAAQLSACALRCPPRVANRRAIEALGLEQPGRRRQMLLALADAAAPGERVQQDLVHAPVERRKLEPLLQIPERLVVGDAARRDAPAAAAWQPRNRRRCAVSQPLKAGLRSISRPSRKSPANSADSARSRSGASVSMPSCGRAGDLDRIDEAVRQVEPDGVAAGVDAPPAGLVDDAPDLAQAPAQLAARIVGNVPQQLAQLAARDRRAAPAPDRRAARAPCATPAAPARRRRG